MVTANLLHKAQLWPHRRLAYSRKSNSYNKLKCPPRIGYRGTIRAVDLLRRLGLVEHETGYNIVGRKGVTSRMRASPSLLALFGEHGLTHRNLEMGERPLIVLKDIEKNAIPFDETESTKRMESVVRLYNHALSAADIRVPADVEDQPDYLNDQVYRVFNNSSFEQGGRFYRPWWQDRKDLRPLITINGNSTVEYDLSCLVAHQAYSYAGVCYHELADDDPYDLPGLDIPRAIRKQAFIISLNVESRATAASALREWMHKEGISHQLKRISAKDLISTTYEKHQPVRDLFFTQIGLQFQYEDSCLTESVIERFLERNMVVLTIHDGFIVEIEQREFLLEILENALDEIGLVSRPPIKEVKNSKPRQLIFSLPGNAT